MKGKEEIDVKVWKSSRTERLDKDDIAFAAQCLALVKQAAGKVPNEKDCLTGGKEEFAKKKDGEKEFFLIYKAPKYMVKLVMKNSNS